MNFWDHYILISLINLPVGCNYLREKRENLVKKNGLDIVQDTEIQYLDVAKQNNIYVKYSKKLFKSFRSYKFFEL